MNNTGAAPCRQFKGSPEIPPQWRTRRSTSTVISTVGSGAPKFHSSITRAALRREISRLCVNSADTSLAIPACSPARDDRAAGSVKGNTFPPYTRHPERQQKISVNTVSEGKGSQYQSAGRRVPGLGMTNTESFTAGTEILRLRLRMTGGAGRAYVLILAVSCPAVISSGTLKFPRNGARGIPPPLSFRPKRSRVIIGKYRDSSPAAQNDRRGGKEDFRRAYHAKKR